MLLLSQFNRKKGGKNMTDDEIKFEKLQKIKKIVMIAVICLLVVWIIVFLYITFTDNDSSEVDTKYEENQKMMQEAIRGYYHDDMLEDNTMVISLKRMYDNSLIDVLKTSYDEECIDMASYARVKKLSDMYQLDVVLVCGNRHETLTSYYDLECGLTCDPIIS